MTHNNDALVGILNERLRLLLRTMDEFITQPGAPCFQHENKADQIAAMRRRLDTISQTARSAINIFGEA